jgi:hypothetical protein
MKPTTISYYCPRLPGEELSRPCDCDPCMGACNNGEGGKCGECFVCEEIADDKRWWEVNREDILQI